MNLALNLILATEAVEPVAEESGGIALLLPAPEELIAGLSAFIIIFLVVWKFALPSLMATLEARQNEIKTRLESAERSKDEAAELLTDYKAQVAGAKDEASQIVADARDAGEAVKADIVARAEAEAEAIRARGHEEVVAERDRVSADLRRQVADLSLDVAQRVVVSSLDADAQRALVDQYIDDLGGVQ